MTPECSQKAKAICPTEASVRARPRLNGGAEAVAAVPCNDTTAVATEGHMVSHCNVKIACEVVIVEPEAGRC